MAIYSQRVFGMYGGEQMYVRISADPSLAGVVFDRFGTELTVLNHDDRFEFAVKVMVSPTFFAWVLGFGGKMKILSPDFVAEQAASIAREVVALYETDSTIYRYTRKALKSIMDSKAFLCYAMVDSVLESFSFLSSLSSSSSSISLRVITARSRRCS